MHPFPLRDPNPESRPDADPDADSLPDTTAAAEPAPNAAAGDASPDPPDGDCRLDDALYVHRDPH